MEENQKRDVDLNLRQFIKNLGYITGGTALLSSMPWLMSCTPERLKEIKSEKARVAVIGTGSRGMLHIFLLQQMQHVEIVALCDIYSVNLEKAAQKCPMAKTYKNYRKLLEDPEIDGVLIATPLYLHAQMVIDSLQAGKHVFCEKAMGHTPEQCKQMYDASMASDKAVYFGLQRMYDEKYIIGMQQLNAGLIGDLVGMRCHWFRNADWRRPVPSPELERHINWRLYKKYSGGLMTELACHQLGVCNWATGKTPVDIMGMGDLVYWKDGREVYDSVSLVYRYADGRKITYESLISNKFNGMEDQLLGKKGTMELSKGVYYLEEDNKVSGIRKLITEVKDKVYNSIPTAGPSWHAETRKEYVPHYLIEGNAHIRDVNDDGTANLLSAFCQSCITGEKVPELVEQAYCTTLLCLYGTQAMEEKRCLRIPDEYKTPYMKF